MAVPVNQPESPVYNQTSESYVDTDDIWADSDDGNTESHVHSMQTSEIPKLRREHHNAGYLEGVTVSKDQYLQEGFDAGYPSGAVVGLQAGQILGTLQGLGLHDVEKIAKAELSPEQLFSHKYYNEADELARPKFNEEEGHPEIVRWKEQVKKLLEG